MDVYMCPHLHILYIKYVQLFTCTLIQWKERRSLREEGGERRERQGRRRGGREKRKKEGGKERNVREERKKKIKKIRNETLWYKGRVPKQYAKCGNRNRQLLNDSELKIPAVEVAEVLEGREAASNKEFGKVPKPMGGAADRPRP